jgi:hypothetical protein
MWRNGWIILWMAGLGISPAFGCDLCGCYTAREARISKPGFFVGVYEQYTRFGSLREDGREVPNEAGQYLDSSITQFLAGYQFGDRLAVQFNLPLVHRAYRRPVEEGVETGAVSGLGDAAVTVRYRAFGRFESDSTLLWHVLGGLKMPTGNSDRLLEELNETEPGEGQPSGIHGHDLTLGSGSWDGMVGSMFYAHRGRIFGEAAVHYTFRSQGRIDYRFANDLLWRLAPGVYLLQDHRRSLSVGVTVSGEAKGKDTFQGEKAEDTGMTSVLVGPEVGLTWRHTLDGMFGADFPLILHNTSFQAVPDYRLRVAVVWRF